MKVILVAVVMVGAANFLAGLVLSPVVSAQETPSDARVAALEKQVQQLQAQLAESKKLTPEQQAAERLDVFTRVFKAGPQSTDWKACKAAGGKTFAVLVVDSKPAVSCAFDVK